ncbi:hypothetical protein [Bradyrhizobium sp. G127]|uniref:hypothetical protein n=1 Tax=Bradyrhizobium sp. G127 TaxID=2904800 RepID=UPI001F1EF642|nr:hypothetical protein [Bradyrhizobium sp. G127]MCF2523908.1 hypothetical protein [Bradyrhizobium sp. G127]
MVGTITLAGTQRLHSVTAKPLNGGKVWIIQAGTTSAPQDGFYDSALTQPLPRPITLDAGGNIPFFYLEDGQVKIRIEDANGLQQFAQDNIPVIGPSSGESGGGGVDPTTIAQTGDVIWSPVNSTRTGWVRLNGRTVGNTSSGATERANADTSALYTVLWNNFSDTLCHVTGGRGANAAADYAANKPIALLNGRNVVLGGLDDMGNTAAGGYTGVPVIVGNVTTAGSIVGETVHALIAAEHASHDHDVFINDPGHNHTLTNGLTGANGVSVGTGSGSGLQTVVSIGIQAATTGVQVRSASGGGGTQNKTNTQGSGTAHNNVQKTMLGTFFIKL